MMPADLDTWLRAHAIESVRLDWPDLNGLARTKRVPATRFATLHARGIQFSDAALTFDVQSVPAAGTSTGAVTGFRNVRALPDLGSLRRWPGTARAAWCMTDIVDAEGRPVGSAPRTFARRVESALATLGLTALIAPELEFYLSDPGGAVLETGSPCYGSELPGVPEAALVAVLDAVRAFWSLEAWHHEHGPGQLEVNVEPLPFLAAVDALHGVRLAVREAAAVHGLRATFMAKPFNGRNGSACQVNVSLLDAAGTNQFYEPSTGDLSKTALAFIAGLLAHLDELAALLLPNANSYRRLVPGHFAPVSKAWGLDNRTAAVRAIVDGPGATRVELRVPGADIAAHLAVPALVAAGLDGIRRNLEPGLRATGSLDAAEGPKLVRDWSQALDVATRSAWFRETLSEELAVAFLAVKRQEHSRYSRWVSDFDRAEYAGCF